MLKIDAIMNHGGRRTGAGRTKVLPKRITTIRFTMQEHANYMAAGGARWLRRMIAELKALNEKNN